MIPSSARRYLNNGAIFITSLYVGMITEMRTARKVVRHPLL